MAVLQITSLDCRQTSESLSASLGVLDVDLHPGSDLARMISDFEWLGSYPDAAEQPGAAHADDPTRALESFPRIEQARRIEAALRRCREASGASGVASRLRSKLDALETQSAPAQDFLLELEMGGRLVAKGVSVDFAEPDLVCRVAGLEAPFGIACKRPRSVSKVRRHVMEGARQLERSGMDGFVLIGLESILRGSGDPTKPTKMYDMLRPEDIQTLLQPQVSALARDLKSTIEPAWSCGVLGVVLCGLAYGFSRDPTAFVYAWLRSEISGPSAGTAGQMLDELLFRPLM